MESKRRGKGNRNCTESFGPSNLVESRDLTNQRGGCRHRLPGNRAHRPSSAVYAVV